jgi:hypothetical protein
MTRHLHGVKPPATSRTNDLARRQMLFAAVGQLIDTEPPLVDADDLRLALLTERVGEVGACYWRAHRDLEGELQKVMATAGAWLEAIERGRAR